MRVLWGLFSRVATEVYCLEGRGVGFIEEEWEIKGFSERVICVMWRE